MQINHISSLHGEVSIPGDKSISHRAIMFGSLSDGVTEVTNFLEGADCLSTISCFQKMGIDIINTNSKVIIHGKGLHGLTTPSSILDVGNSGTTTRLISGILSGQPFSSILTGDASIQKRPMMRILSPLRMMNADMQSINDNNCAPLQIHGKALTAIHYNSPVASAQVKSCVLLAGLYADGKTSVTEPVLSRNHTELMLSSFGATIQSDAATASILPNPSLHGQKIAVPGDISSAAYFIVAGLIIPNSELFIRNVGINPTRDGILTVAKNMGASIERINEHLVSGEPVCDLLVKSSALHGTTVCGSIIPSLIDEIPVIAVMAAFANGTTIIKDASELKVKESNRIDTVVTNLKSMGCNIAATDDGMIIQGGTELHGAIIDSYLDHRIAMTFTVAGMAADGITEIKNHECIDISYPTFYEDMKKLTK